MPWSGGLRWITGWCSELARVAAVFSCVVDIDPIARRMDGLRFGVKTGECYVSSRREMRMVIRVGIRVHLVTEKFMRCGRVVDAFVITKVTTTGVKGKDVTVTA